MRRPAMLSALAALALAMGCLFESDPSVAGGTSGSENTNGTAVSARLFHTDGSAAVQARIWIRPYDYLRDTGQVDDTLAAAQAVTDERGDFTLDSVAAGTYVLEARDREGNGLARTVEVFGARRDLGRDTLRVTGGLAGVLELPPQAPGSGFVQIFGLDRVAKVDAGGAYAFGRVPPGSHRIHAVSSVPGRAYRQPDPVFVDAGKVTALDTLALVGFDDENYQAWPFSRALRIDAAGVTEAVADLPVLVRLDSSNFNFALSDGRDLRFSAADGGHLAYEIERWDPQARKAEIWVRLDSLRGGASATPFTMHWGRLDVPDFSSGAAVFSSFAGAWHMRDRAMSGSGASFLSSSSPGAVLSGPILESDRLGAIGEGSRFGGKQYLASVGTPGLAPTAALTVSAWFQAAKTDVAGSDLVSMGDNYGLRIYPDGRLSFFVFNDSAWTGGKYAPGEKWTRALSAAEKIFDGNWHHIAGVFDGAALRLYLDGGEKAAVPFSGPIRYRLAKDFFLGKHGDGILDLDFTGRLDEIRVSGLARSAAWLRLSFENQKPGSVLVRPE